MGFFSSLMGVADNKELTGALGKGALLVDVRSREEFLSGSVPGAINIPLDKLGNDLSRFRGKEAVVVFCLSGGRSTQAKRLLEQQGIRNVINGGGWQNVKQSLNKIKLHL